jgi:rsbT co-antagonist protein RsbR
MSLADGKRLGALLTEHETPILEAWLGSQSRGGAISPEARQQSSEFLAALKAAVQRAPDGDIGAPAWSDVKRLLGELSAARARQGATPSEVATFVFSLKQALFGVLRSRYAAEPQALVETAWDATALLDRLGLYTTEVSQRSRDDVISRQQQELLELTTPVVELWEDIIALPLIGTLDSARTQVVMENLLQKIVDTGSSVAILDITGVPMVDTLVAQHLLKTVAAARLMGADCVISGIRPQIAQTIVHLGVDLSEVTTKATLADAFKVALARTGASISSPQAARAG